MANSEYNLTVVDGTALTISLSGPVGPAGAGGGGTVDATIIDGSTNAVSGNAVFDALALKAPLASPTFTGASNFSGEIILNEASSSITTFGVGGFISTDGNNADIFTNGTAAGIHTGGINATIYTTGTNAQIYTDGQNAYIQTRATFKLFNGNHTSTLSHNPTANHDIAFPDASGTVPVVPAYVGIDAANAALGAGDFWWDTTLKKLRTATA
jgi:hypothetical protein